ncbi:hypothetical protein ACFU99_20375 [Streptomyces sp. NPDC057654]|uniref:hypothetical protein n=1 Tax=Streptomyces sp. NPDC057654 TaxID=3346196 RepID=UPI00369B285D
MIPFVVTLFAALIGLGFAYPILWVAAALLLFAFTRYGTLSGLRLRDDPGYREYRERRVRQDRYDRRFRREQDLWGRRTGGLLGGPAGAKDKDKNDKAESKDKDKDKDKDRDRDKAESKDDKDSKDGKGAKG